MAGFLDKLSSSLKSALKKSGASVLGIDVSSSTIKVVQIRKKGGRAILETYGELSLGRYAGVGEGRAAQLPADKMAAALRDLVREAKATTDKCGVAIPLSSSLVNVVKMPDVGDKKLRDMIPLEMKKYVPVAISEVVLDWRVIPRGEETQEGQDGDKKTGKVDVLVVAIHKETVSRYQKIVKDAGLDTTFIEVEVFSTIRAALESSSAPQMVIDMGAGTTKIYVVEHRVLRESHIINRGSQDMTIALSKSLGVSNDKANELKHMYGLLDEGVEKGVKGSVSLILDGILLEAARVLRAYQKRYGKNVGKIVISGGGAGLKGISEAASASLETEVEVADPFSKLVSPAFLESVLKEAGPGFAVAVGVALRKLEEEN